MQAQFVPGFADSVVLSPGVAHQCYHGFIKAVQEGNIQWESRTYPYPGTPITQRFSHSEYPCNPNGSCLPRGLAVPPVPVTTKLLKPTAGPALSTRGGIWELLIMVGSLILGNADGVEVGWDCGFLVVQGSYCSSPGWQTLRDHGVNP